MLREALAGTREQERHSSVAAVAYNSNVAEHIQELSPQLLTLDSSVFARIGLDVVISIRSIVPAIKVLMVGMDSDRELFLRCVRAGVCGYVLKEASANEVAAAVRSVAYDGAVCPPKFCAALFEEIASSGSQLGPYRGKSHFGLTRREQQLVKMMRGFEQQGDRQPVESFRANREKSRSSHAAKTGSQRSIRCGRNVPGRGIVA